MSPSFLVASSVTREFDRGRGHVFVALQDVSFEAARGSFTAIVGPSGSGKSTLLAILAGLDRPTSGRVLYDGENIAVWREKRLCAWRRRNASFVFQTWELIPSLTAMENVCMVLAPTKVWSSVIRRRASLLLRRVGLADKAHDFPPRLSGGEQQRIALARAVVSEPRILFADEPTGNIDADASRVILELLREQANGGTTIVLVSHDERIAACADQVLHLLGGRIIPGGKLAEEARPEEAKSPDADAASGPS
jgi:ABC-type lipoprotein export system ATPase subunit